MHRAVSSARVSRLSVSCDYDLRNELKTIIENQFKESCHGTSRQKQNNDDVITLLKEEIGYLKGELKEKIKVISNLNGFRNS